MRKIRILVVDDHAVLRAGLRLLIEAQPDMRVVGEAADAREIEHEVKASKPDLVLMDLTMPGAQGAGHVARTLTLSPRLRVLVLTMHDDPSYARAALAAGASGYVVKSAAHTELISAIRAVHRGRTFVDVRLREEVRGAEAAVLVAPAARGQGPGLSRREEEVLGFIARGHTNREIAAKIGVGVKTVETYRLRVGQKLGLIARSDFVQYALESGLFGPGKASDRS